MVGSINSCTAARYRSYITPTTATAATWSLRHFRFGKCVVKGGCPPIAGSDAIGGNNSVIVCRFQIKSFHFNGNGTVLLNDIIIGHKLQIRYAAIFKINLLIGLWRRYTI